MYSFLFKNFSNSFTIEVGKHGSKEAGEFAKKCVEIAVDFLLGKKVNQNN